MKEKWEVIYLQLAVCKSFHWFENTRHLKIKGNFALFVIKTKWIVFWPIFTIYRKIFKKFTHIKIVLVKFFLFGLMFIVFYLAFQVMDEFGAHFLSIYDRIWSLCIVHLYHIPLQTLGSPFLSMDCDLQQLFPFKDRCSSMV